MPTNKQPLFAGTVRMITNTFDPPTIYDHYNTNNTWSQNPTPVYTAASGNGDIVDRITISATGDLNTNTTVTAKLIYIYLFCNNTGLYSLYKTLAMPAATISATTPNPELELVFTGGLLLNSSDIIYIGASTNASTTGHNGDYISVTVEGGTYDLS